MKIAILTPTFNYYSGIDRVVQQQAEDYTKKRHKVTVIALEANIKPKNYKVLVLGMPKNPFFQRLYRLFFFLDIKKMNYYKNLKDYDIVVSHFYPMNLLACKARKKYKIKYIYFDHGINISALDNFFQELYMKIFLFFSNMTLRNIDEACSVSKFLGNELYKQSGIRSRVVYNKIDVKKLKKAKGGAVRKKYNLENNKVLLYVGRLAPHKGVHLLIEAFKLIKIQIPNAKLLIVGKSTFENYFRKLKKISDSSVIFAGTVSDNNLSSYYAACDVYVTASLWEGFNIPAAEAQACNKPVVAFNIGSHPEIIKRGTLVEKGNVEKFADAIIKLLR